MRKSIYSLICFAIFLASCGSHKPPEIPFKKISNDTAILMWKKYNTPLPTADTSYREFPKMYGFDTKTIKSIIAKSNEGKVTAVNFLIAAYLDERSMYSKNTVLMQIVREKEKKKHYYYYDIRQPDATLNMSKGDGLPLCPPPKDCVPPGMGDAKD